MESGNVWKRSESIKILSTGGMPHSDKFLHQAIHLDLGASYLCSKVLDTSRHFTLRDLHDYKLCAVRLEAPISLPYQHLALMRCVLARVSKLISKVQSLQSSPIQAIICSHFISRHHFRVCSRKL